MTRMHRFGHPSVRHGLRRRVLHAGVVGVGILATAAVIGPPFIATSAAGSSATVVITESLAPAHLTITPGTTVVWRNDDGDRHEIRSTSGPRSFRTDDLDPGDRGSVTLSTEGEYRYHDHRNDDDPAYFGRITVRAGAPTTTGGGGSTAPPPTTTPPPSRADVRMAGETFRPANVTIAVGGTVAWLNDDSRPHTVTANGGSFDSGPMSVGARYEHRFDTPGSFAYFCEFHGDMRASVTVVRPGSPPPPTTTPPPTPTTRPPGPSTTTPPTTTPPPPPPAQGTVLMSANRFSPTTVRVRPGGTVTWENRDTVMHTVTADDGSFDSSFLAAGARWSHRFDRVGTFHYSCILHSGMTGTVVVTNSSTAPPPPPNGGGNGGGSGGSGSGGGGSGGGGSGNGGGGTGGGGSGAAGSATIDLLDNRFSPSAVSVGAGATVAFNNRGSLPHTATSSAGGTGTLMPGDGGSVSFDTPGSYTVTCDFHPEMTATVTVSSQRADPSVSTGAGGGNPRTGTRSGIEDRDKENTTNVTGADPTLEPVDVEVGDNFFSPAAVDVPVGGTVRWSFVGAVPHSVTAVDGNFDSGILSNGAEFSAAFDVVGSVDYVCLLHPDMRGTINVVEVGDFVPVGNDASVGPAPPATTSSPDSGLTARSLLIGFAASAGLLLALAALFAATARFVRGMETPPHPAT